MNCDRCGADITFNAHEVTVISALPKVEATLCVVCGKLLLGFMKRLDRAAEAIPMILTCPGPALDGRGICGARHIDRGAFATKLHHTHSCQTCGFTWRPAVGFTVGVEFLPGFKDEGPAT